MGSRLQISISRQLLPPILITLLLASMISCQLPDDIQQELDRSIAEQARIDALRRQAQARAANQGPTARQAGPQQQQQAPHDPNNYSYQQVSPPIQYSYYQPFGDAANQPAQPQPEQAALRRADNKQQQAMNLDLNNLNFDDLASNNNNNNRPSQPAAGQQQLAPSFTGAGGLPVLQPIASANQQQVPVGQAPLAPQARVQQGPPLTEADFKDITGGENYGAPGGSDFGLGDAGLGGGASGANRRNQPQDNTDAQLREFGMPFGAAGNQRQRSSGGVPDFGAFGGGPGSGMINGAGNARQDQMPSMNEFGLGNAGGQQAPGGGNDFDFASQPSSQQQNQDQASTALNGGAPGSLQSLLGAGFPGLSGGNGGSQQNGLDSFAQGNNDPQRARMDDNSMDIANLGDKSDQFSGADLGGFEQPGPQNDQDFNYGASSNQQPKSVPYPDANPQPVGTLLALTQPQSLSQARYSLMPDKGTYQDYPAYQSGGNDFSAVASVVDGTPVARRGGPGRYSWPSSGELAYEFRRQVQSNGQFDYSRGPREETVGDY